jgi:acetyl esterase
MSAMQERTWLERVKGSIVAALLGLPRPVQRLLAGRPIRRDGLELDVSSQLLLRLESLDGGSRVERLGVDEARAHVRSRARTVNRRPAQMARVAELKLPGPAGHIPARAYLPTTTFDRPGLLLYFHGGGHVYGDLDTHDGVCRFLAHHGRIAVMSVDYRLAPEHPFPAAPEDTVAALRFAFEQSARIDEALGLTPGEGIDTARIAVGGDSAGGNLAAVTALSACEGEAPLPAFQLLIYPVCDYSYKRPSHATFGEGFRLTAEEMDWFKRNYLPAENRGELERDWRVSPILATDLSGLPPAYVCVAGCDPLRDEGEDYAEAMRAAGVAVTLRRHDGLLHSFANQTDINRPAREAMLEAAAALREALRPARKVAA